MRVIDRHARRPAGAAAHAREAADISRRRNLAAWLHLAAGGFIAGTTATLWLCAALLAPTFSGTFIPELVALFGRPIAIAAICVGTVEMTGAVAVLRRLTWGNATLLTISVLQLPVFPIGTALSAYTAWALFS